MLYFGNGARNVMVGDRTVQLYPDFSDPTAYYVLPNFPHVAKTEEGTPAIRLLIFREDLSELPEGQEEAVGFLSLDVDLSWDPELLEKAARKIQRDDELDEMPRLSPIFYREGTAKMMLLDAATPEEGEEPQVTDFVMQILGTSSPSLYGDCRAIFQAKLSKKGATALRASLDGFTPIGVHYSLTFAGLQPAFNIKANVDWDKVHDHFSEKTDIDAFFYQEEISNQIDTLVENQAITIEVTVEGVGAEAMDTMRNQAMEQIRTLIFEKFFEATFDPLTGAGGGTVNDVVEAFHDLHRPFGYSYVRKTVKIEELRELDLDWTARKAALRTIHPQAHMNAIIKQGEVTPEQLVTVVDGGADAIWKTMGFTVNAAAAWETDGIAGITVDVEYDDADSGDTHHWSTFLDKAKPTDSHRDWMDRSSGNEFRYKYEVVFSDEGVPGPRPKVSSGDWQTHEGSVLVIHPRELYESIELEVGVVPGFAFDRWPAVQAVMRYRTEDGSFEHYADGVLKKDAPSFKTRFRVDAGVPAIREIRLTYIGAEGERVEQAWMPMPQRQWVVEDPHGEKLEVRAIVAGNRRNIANLIVDLEYTDPDNGIHHTGTLSFDAENINKPLMWKVALADATKRRYRYRMTLVTNEGDFLQTGWLGTDAPTLPVGEVYVRRLNVELVTGELAEGVTAVEVKLEYGEEGGEQHETRTFTLGPNARNEWMVQLSDASRRDYQVTITWIREDGFNITQGPTTHTSSLLVIPPGPQED